jgi:hypothetical protein
VTCDRLVVFSGYSDFLHNKTDSHDITEILLAFDTINPECCRDTNISYAVVLGIFLLKNEQLRE